MGAAGPGRAGGVLWACCCCSETHTVLLGTEFSVNEQKLPIYTVRRKRRKGGGSQSDQCDQPWICAHAVDCQTLVQWSPSLRCGCLVHTGCRKFHPGQEPGAPGKELEPCLSAQPVLSPLYQRERRGFQSSLLRPAPPCSALSSSPASSEMKGEGDVALLCWRPRGLQPTRLLHPWDFPGKSISFSRGSS